MKNSSDRWLQILVFVTAALLILSACAPAAAPPTSAPTAAGGVSPTAATKAATSAPAAAQSNELPKLKVAMPHPTTPETGVPVIAQAMGYFKDEGVDVELVFTKGGGDTVQAVQVPGGADIGLMTGPMSILGAIEKGADLKIISAATTPGDQQWITTGDSPYKTIKDLEGKPVGYTSAGSSSNLYLLGITEKEGVKVQPVAAGELGGNMWTQIKTGQLAAGISTPPDSWDRIEKEGARKLFGTTDYPEFADYTYIVNFARGDSFKTKADAIKAFFRAWNKASQLIINDPATATKAYMPNAELPEDIVLRYFKSIPPTKFRLKPIGGMDISVKYAKDFKFVTKDPDLNTAVDLSLVP